MSFGSRYCRAVSIPVTRSAPPISQLPNFFFGSKNNNWNLIPRHDYLLSMCRHMISVFSLRARYFTPIVDVFDVVKLIGLVGEEVHIILEI